MSIQAVRVHVGVYRGKPNLGLINQTQIGKSQMLASKIAFQASMERALLNQKYWNDLLEKLRKMGGGGGSSDSRFDRVLVSMQLMNFLSNKTIQAMLRNFTGEFMKLVNELGKSFINNNPVLFANIQRIGEFVTSSMSFVFAGLNRALNIGRDMINRVSIGTINQLSGFLGVISFQLNKLQEILQEKLNELIKKSDVKGKMRKIKVALLDFFVEMKEEVLELFKEVVTFFSGFYDLIYSNNK